MTVIVLPRPWYSLLTVVPVLAAGLIATIPATFVGDEPAGRQPVDTRLQLMDVFDLEFAGEPQISPDGQRVVYLRNSFDVMKDRRRSNLWIVTTGRRFPSPSSSIRR